MKLIFCPYCQDVLKLLAERRACECGRSWGNYVDKRRASIGGSAVPLGFDNESLVSALEARPQEGSGQRFEAFVIAVSAESIEDVGSGGGIQFRGPVARAGELVAGLLAGGGGAGDKRTGAAAMRRSGSRGRKG
ncbi:hypothetical protein [Ottowia sp.]|uniref:hypothetical protein n=1 Tax=Ottowia sp. TaxID=1898956 RepID=UPI0025DC05AC|nr:hypothetical protein [Ottowia sp.]MBK6616516.1 hypothetical protein [Ottowia sp.]